MVLQRNSQPLEKVLVAICYVHELAEVEDCQITQVIVLGLTTAKCDHFPALIETVRSVEALCNKILLAFNRRTVPKHGIEVKRPYVIQVSSLITLTADDDHETLQ